MSKYTYLFVFINLFASGFIFISNGFLLFLQKNCEFCSVLIVPILTFAVFFLSAIVFVRLKNPEKLRSARWLRTINIIGALASVYYLVETYAV